MILTFILLGGLVTLLIYYYWTLKLFYKYFERRNIPGPPPKLFFGHYLSLWSTPLFARQIPEWTQQYGSIYGIFQGTTPIYIVSNVDFLQEVFIKQFSIFHSRPLNFLIKMIRARAAPSLFTSPANHWRRQRHIINPTFSATKLKMMNPLIHKCIYSLMNKLDQQKQNEFNIFVLYKRLTLDVIWHCAFGIDTDLQNDIDNIYMKKSLASFTGDPEKLLLVRLSNLLPFLTPFLLELTNISLKLINFIRTNAPSLMKNVEDPPQLWIFKQIENVVKQRLASDNKRTDLLQLMLDASTQEQIKDDENDELISKKLQYREVLINAVLFLNAGFETTSLNLAYSTYELAKHHDIQLKLQDEIDQHWKDDQEQIDYDIINDLKYLDIFIKEVLRMYSTTHRIFGRIASQSTTICGHFIEKDAIIQADSYTIHRNVDLWGPEDPNEFIPERHLAERHPLAYMPFGVGPRNCVGMRLALMELKVVLANILHKYNILPGEKIEEGMKRQETFTLSPEAVYVKMEQRSK